MSHPSVERQTWSQLHVLNPNCGSFLHFYTSHNFAPLTYRIDLIDFAYTILRPGTTTWKGKEKVLKYYLTRAGHQNLCLILLSSQGRKCLVSHIATFDHNFFFNVKMYFFGAVQPYPDYEAYYPCACLTCAAPKGGTLSLFMAFCLSPPSNSVVTNAWKTAASFIRFSLSLKMPALLSLKIM